MRTIAQLRVWTVGGTYIDDDLWASKTRGPGIGWGRILAAAADAGKINTVLAVDFDRLLRGVRDLIDHGLMAVTVDDEIDLLSPVALFDPGLHPRHRAGRGKPTIQSLRVRLQLTTPHQRCCPPVSARAPQRWEHPAPTTP
ncbi:hypothetical protein [Arthrobacter sp. H16F315]|uniref:hypothetical protein n=1 Tax=Arthrobacter sp. H16F315 TaxID=2955314 RepID=UPI0020981E8E|nr:hypothetical protein [Arthrobacter sp. H16F315]MDD1475477.1 hypothetical protein [Arthrobacter sp. H16F315]